jgi:hypothetical protein
VLTGTPEGVAALQRGDKLTVVGGGAECLRQKWFNNKRILHYLLKLYSVYLCTRQKKYFKLKRP